MALVFLYPLKTSENLWFSDVFREYYTPFIESVFGVFLWYRKTVLYCLSILQKDTKAMKWAKQTYNLPAGWTKMPYQKLCPILMFAHRSSNSVPMSRPKHISKVIYKDFPDFAREMKRFSSDLIACF